MLIKVLHRPNDEGRDFLHTFVRSALADKPAGLYQWIIDVHGFFSYDLPTKSRQAAA
jgi:hypothetical protein